MNEHLSPVFANLLLSLQRAVLCAYLAQSLSILERFRSVKRTFMSISTEQHTPLQLRQKTYLSLAFVLAFVLLVLCLPSKTSTTYSYEENRPWHYGQLIAPFDFPILLSDAQMKERHDSAMAIFMPYFTGNDSVGARNIQLFATDFDKGTFTGVPSSYRSHLLQLLAKVYEAGIVSNNDYQLLANQKTKSIRFVQGNIAVTQDVDAIYTTHAAYDFIMGNDNEHYSREILQNIDLTQYLAPNLALDTTKTQEAMREVEENLTRSAGMVQVGERIIDRGEIITPKRYSIITSYFKELDKRSETTAHAWEPFLGKGLLIFLFMGSSIVYLYTYRPDYFSSPNRTLLFLCLVCIFPLLTYLMIEHSVLNIYMLPFPMVAVFARIFYDSRTAVQVGFTSALISSIAVSDPYGFLLLQLAVSTAAIYGVKEITERAQLFKVAVIVLAMALTFSAIYDIYEGTSVLRFFDFIDRGRYFSLIVSGVLLLLSYPLFYLVERLFNLTSSVTLIELSNINNKTLRNMTKVAQGTFNHSLQVGNLAAEVADAIGADAQLVRTAAFYHDIGKTEDPSYFTENQQGTNPHDALTPEESATIIIRHVTHGIEMAKAMHLPQVIIDFIPTHHGRSKTGYFYIEWKNAHNQEEPPAGTFDYPGPNPWTREQAILMMCDAVEAASRSLTDYSHDNISALVTRIIDGQKDKGLFNDAPITFQDITTAKKVLIESLKVIYHTRIAYPEEKPRIVSWFTPHRRHRR